MAGGVRSALALGLLVGLFNLIPYFGPVLGAVPALLGADLGLADGGVCRHGADHRATARRAAHLPAGDGALTGLSPAAVLVGVFAGGCALGVPGMLLALPVMMVFEHALEFLFSGTKTFDI